MWLIGIAAFGLCVPGALAGKSEAIEVTPAVRADIRFRMLQNGIIEVPVIINGRGPFYFILDTATQTSVIDTRVAKGLRLEATDRLNLRTPTGEKTLIRAFVDNLSVGAFSEARFEVLEDRFAGAVIKDQAVDGILGQNFLSKYDVLLDYKQSAMSLWPTGRGRAPSGARIPLVFHNGCPTVRAAIGKGTPLRLYLDSGTTALTLFRDSPDFQRCILSSCGGTLTNTVSSSHVIQGAMRSLWLGNIHMRDVPTFLAQEDLAGKSNANAIQRERGAIQGMEPDANAATDRESAMKPPDAGDLLDGMLPTNLFSSIYISMHDAYAVINSR
jgi:hypothetical protein